MRCHSQRCTGSERVQGDSLYSFLVFPGFFWGPCIQKHEPSDILCAQRHDNIVAQAISGASGRRKTLVFKQHFFQQVRLRSPHLSKLLHDHAAPQQGRNATHSAHRCSIFDKQQYEGQRHGSSQSPELQIRGYLFSKTFIFSIAFVVPNNQEYNIWIYCTTY